MLGIYEINGISAPMLTCDICGEQLAEVGKSAVVFNNFAPAGTRQSVIVVHKGSIDGRTCHATAEANIKKAGGTSGWQEMSTYLTHLAHNLQLTPARITEILDGPTI